MRSPGFPGAVQEAQLRGYLAMTRLAGGRAAVFHRGTIAFSWAQAANDPREDITGRFRELSAIVVDALESLGADGRVGELPGEYCAGKFSVNLGGEIKVMGVGQRLIRGAAHVGGVIVVDDSAELRGILGAVYSRLGIQWRPETAGALEDRLRGVSIDGVIEAMMTAFSRRYRVTETEIPEDIVERGRLIGAEHVVGRSVVS